MPFDPSQKIDCTWEREWRICCDELLLEPEHSLIVVPDAKTAFEIAYSYSQEEMSITGNPTEIERQGVDKALTVAPRPKWMTVSLDLFDIDPNV